MPLTGRIIEWQRERGFGYLDCEGRRIFLHVREFKDRYKQPEVGDAVTFVMGVDRQGRPCAQQVVMVYMRTRLKLRHLLILVFLLLPGLAVFRRFGVIGLKYAAIWVTLVSVFTYWSYAWDKRQAQQRGRREPEKMLHLFEFLGGWPGAFFAQRRLRHKSAKGSYQFLFVFIIGLHQFLAIDSLRDWPFVRLVARALQRLAQEA